MVHENKIFHIFFFHNSDMAVREPKSQNPNKLSHKRDWDITKIRNKSLFDETVWTSLWQVKI